jgi:hypothetical protein
MYNLKYIQCRVEKRERDAIKRNRNKVKNSNRDNGRHNNINNHGYIILSKFLQLLICLPIIITTIVRATRALLLLLIPYEKVIKSPIDQVTKPQLLIEDYY